MRATTAPENEITVETWRWDRARELGYSPMECWEIARDAEIDWHRLADLIAVGCDPALALSIVAS